MKNRVKSNIFFLMFIAWLIPGSGHYLLGKKDKGLFFFVVLTLTFIAGLFLGGRSFFLDGESYFTFLGFTAQIFNGSIYIISTVFGLFKDNLTGVYYDSGVVFNIVPGLLNFLVILDAGDIYRKEIKREE